MGSSSPPEIPAWRTVEREEVMRCRVFSVERRHDVEDPVADEPRKEGDFYVIQAPDWVNVVALTEDDRLVLVEQWRHGTEHRTLEIPGGMVDPDEDAEAAARRELVEESGFTATDWRRLGTVEPNPAIQNNRLTTYLALGSRATEPQRLDGNERCRVVTVPWSEVPTLIANGRFSHALVVSGLAFELVRRATRRR